MYRRRRIEQILHGARALGGGVRSIDESCFLTHDEKYEVTPLVRQGNFRNTKFQNRQKSRTATELN